MIAQPGTTTDDLWDVHRHQSVRRFARATGFTASVLLGVLCLVWTAAVLLLHVRFAPVLTGSMTPTFRPGDAVITRQVPADSVRPGQIIVFRPPGSSAAYAHRVVTVRPSPAGPVITTKGDANPVPDGWHAALTEPTTPQVIGHVPYLGRALVFFGTPLARVIGVAVVGLVLTALATAAALGPAPHQTLPSGRHRRPANHRPAIAG